MSEAQAPAIPATLSIAAPDSAVLTSTASKMLADARSVVIDSQDMYEIANDELISIKSKWTSMEETRVKLTKPLNDVVRGINDLFRQPMLNLAEGETILKKAMLTFANEQERKRLEAQAKADREAREAREKADREAREARQALEVAAETGDTAVIEQAQAVVQAAEQTVELVVSAPVHHYAPAKLAGTSVRKTWKARLPQTDEDKLKLLAFIIKNPAFLHLVDVSQSECNKLAVAMKRNMKVDGIEAYEDSGITARAR